MEMLGHLTRGGSRRLDVKISFVTEKLSLFKRFLSWRLCHVKSGVECLG